MFVLASSKALTCAWSPPRCAWASVGIADHGLHRTLSPMQPRWPPPKHIRRGRLLTGCSGPVSTYTDPALLAEAHEFFAQHGVRLDCVSAAPCGSRTTSRIAVRAAGKGTAVVGMFKPGTHDVVPCRDDERCHAPHHPSINRAIEAVCRGLSDFEDLSAYDEGSRQGTLRYLQLSVERASDQVQLTLVANARTLDADPALARFAAWLWARHGSGGVGRPDEGKSMSQVSSSAEEGSGSSGEGGGSSREGDGSSVVKSSLEEAAPLAWHSIWVNLNPSALNNILSYEEGSWKLMHARGDGQQAGCLIERFPSGAAFVLPPYVFRQPNLGDFDATSPHLTLLFLTLSPAGQPGRLRRDCGPGPCNRPSRLAPRTCIPTRMPTHMHACMHACMHVHTCRSVQPSLPARASSSGTQALVSSGCRSYRDASGCGAPTSIRRGLHSKLLARCSRRRCVGASATWWAAQQSASTTPLVRTYT